MRQSPIFKHIMCRSKMVITCHGGWPADCRGRVREARAHQGPWPKRMASWLLHGVMRFQPKLRHAIVAIQSAGLRPGGEQHPAKLFLETRAHALEVALSLATAFARLYPTRMVSSAVGEGRHSTLGVAIWESQPSPRPVRHHSIQARRFLCRLCRLRQKRRFSRFLQSSLGR